MGESGLILGGFLLILWIGAMLSTPGLIFN